MLLVNKNAIVTGAKKGIGLATVEVLAKNGANVWACARRKDVDFEKKLVEISKKFEVAVKPIYFDLTDRDEMKDAVKQIISEKKQIDILVNNAGIAKYASFSLITEPVINEIMDNNFVSPILFSQLIARKMMRNENGGSIIFLSSMSAFHPEIGNIAYGASKSAVSLASYMMAKELATYKIRVNAVAPGIVNTEMKKLADSSVWNALINKNFLKREAFPEEIANVICFLASDLASYVTGQTLHVDGGM